MIMYRIALLYTYIQNKKKSKPTTCPICDTAILDDKQESIYCEGKCKAWLHRKCTGMSKLVFSTFRNSDNSFECLYCVFCKYKQEVEDLKIQVSSLTTELATRKNLHNLLQPVKLNQTPP